VLHTFVRFVRLKLQQIIKQDLLFTYYNLQEDLSNIKYLGEKFNTEIPTTDLLAIIAYGSLLLLSLPRWIRLSGLFSFRINSQIMNLRDSR
jgi:hypothetical protein